MFTGIVQATGTVRSVRRGSSGVHLVLDAPELARPIPGGSSICVSGVCLTVIRSDDLHLEFDVVPETLRRSTIGSWLTGRRVNLERSLQAGDPMDGHVVQGHIDDTARVATIGRDAGAHKVIFSAEDSLMAFLIPKGSVAIDGVSLTIAGVAGAVFEVALIPATLEATTLGELRIGDVVNVETDIVARTIVTTLERWQARTGAGGVSVDMLREGGWV